jgi:hypothetical protein
MLTTVRQVAEWFGGVRGRRKTILLVSEGIDYDITNVIAQMDAPSNSASMLLDEIRETVSATARANVSIYAIDPRGLTQLGDESIGVAGWADAQGSAGNNGNDPNSGQAVERPRIGLSSLRNDLQLSQDSLRSLADETGGFAAVNTNQFTTAFERIVSDSSSYYVLAYYPPSPKRDGKFHRIEVNVTRPGLTVRARRGYAAPRGKPVEVRATKDGPSPAALEALNSPLPVSGLGTRLFAAPFKGPNRNASVLLGIEIVGRDLNLDANNRVDVSYLAVDKKGKIFGSRTEKVTLNLRPETRTRVQQSAFRVLARMELPPGTYQVRAATHDTAGGGIGSVIQDLEVPDFTQPPLSISGIAITSLANATAVTVRPDETLKGVLPASPGAIRRFQQDDEIALFAEVYDNAPKVPHGVDISASITADDGKVVYKAEEQRSSSELQGRTGGYGYTTRIPLTDVPPGFYVLTVEARSRLSGNPTASRQVGVEVTPASR